MKTISKLVLLPLLAAIALFACDSANEASDKVMEQVESSKEANSMDGDIIEENTEELEQSIEQTQDAATEAEQATE